MALGDGALAAMGATTDTAAASDSAAAADGDTTAIAAGAIVGLNLDYQ